MPKNGSCQIELPKFEGFRGIAIAVRSDSDWNNAFTHVVCERDELFQWNPRSRRIYPSEEKRVIKDCETMVPGLADYVERSSAGEAL